MGKVWGLADGKDAWLLVRVLHSLLEFLHQVLATDFQFAKQNKFALIRKIHRKDCLDFNTAAGAVQIPSLQEALLTLMPSQACYLSFETVVSVEQISSPGPQAVWSFLHTGRQRQEREGGRALMSMPCSSIVPRRSYIGSTRRSMLGCPEVLGPGPPGSPVS